MYHAECADIPAMVVHQRVLKPENKELELKKIHSWKMIFLLEGSM